MNSDLKDNIHNIDKTHHDVLGQKMKFSALKMRQTRMNQAKSAENFEEFNRLGGEKTLNYINNLIKTSENSNHSVKKTGMDAGRENQFIKTHEKDRDNANPTASSGGLPKINKGSISRKIMTNKEVYNESFEKELSSIKYLIEYMNNNKKQKL